MIPSERHITDTNPIFIVSNTIMAVSEQWQQKIIPDKLVVVNLATMEPGVSTGSSIGTAQAQLLPTIATGQPKIALRIQDGRMTRIRQTTRKDSREM